MQNVAAEFTIGQRPTINAEFSIEESQAIDTIFTLKASPTKVSQLENDLNYQTGEQVEQSVQDAIEPLQQEIDAKVETINGSVLIEATREDNVVTLTSKTFVFEQGIASDIWEINHNLNKYPSVTVVDTAGTVFVAQVEYIDNNNCKIYINGSTKGIAYLN